MKMLTKCCLGDLEVTTRKEVKLKLGLEHDT